MKHGGNSRMALLNSIHPLNGLGWFCDCYDRENMDDVSLAGLFNHRFLGHAAWIGATKLTGTPIYILIWLTAS